MPELAKYILILALFVNWIVQMIAIYKLPESHFRQPSDRILWFTVVLMLFPVGAIVFFLWNHGRAHQIREDREHRERIARRANAPRDQEQS